MKTPCPPVRRLDLVAMRVQEKNRVKAPRNARIAEDIAELDRRITAIEAGIEAILKEDRALATRRTVLRSVPGIGVTLSALLVATMPEIGSTNRRQAASLR